MSESVGIPVTICHNGRDCTRLRWKCVGQKFCHRADMAALLDTRCTKSIVNPWCTGGGGGGGGGEGRLTPMEKRIVYREF